MRAAEAHLGAAEALLVVAPGGDVATAGAPLRRLRNVKVRADGDALVLEATRGAGVAAEALALTFRDPEAPVIRLADGRTATVHVIQLRDTARDPVTGPFLVSIDLRLLFATTFVGALAVAATWWLTRRIVRPIRALRDATRALAAGDLSRRVAATGADEVGELAGAFNAMATELERQQALRKSLLHDVAHELRTPLTALRCRLETLIDGLAADPAQALAGANEEVRHLSRLVGDVQELALAEAHELRLSIEDVDVVQVVASAARAAGLEGDRRLRVDVPATLAVRADPVRLRQVLLNLLTNAERHTPSGGTILVRAELDGNEVVLEVRNSGGVLTDEQLARVFDRFYRADPSRQRATGGSGLGLAIVKHLVETQGGRVWVRREADGMSFGLALPAVSAR